MSHEKQRISTELNVAMHIQMDMLPTEFPESGAFSLYASMVPAKQVGGDFYDFFMVDEDHLGLIMADVSGKGVPAAMFMAITKTILRNSAINTKRTPANALALTNRMICETNKSGFFVTAWLVVLTLSTGELMCCNAGHEYPVLRRGNGEYELIETENFPPLAAMEDTEYDNMIVKLSAGDGLFLYTDGVPEAKSASNTRFGMERMLDVLNKNRGLEPEELLHVMKQKIDSFSGDVDPFDDIMMMSVEYHGR